MSENKHEAFVYKWSNKDESMFYVGYHTGHPDDGYVSSSNSFNAVYSQEPESFVRAVLAVGSTDEMKAFETGYLRAIDAQNNSSYYNKWNNNFDYSPDGKIAEAVVSDVVGILERAGVEKGKSNWREFYTITINDTLISCKPSLVTKLDDRNIHKMIGKPVICKATWLNDYAYFYPKNITLLEEQNESNQSAA